MKRHLLLSIEKKGVIPPQHKTEVENIKRLINK